MEGVAALYMQVKRRKVQKYYPGRHLTEIGVDKIRGL